MTLVSDRARVGDTGREAEHAAEDLKRRVEPQLRPGLWRRYRYWILAIPGLFLGAHLASGVYVVGADERAVVRRFGAVEAEVGPGMAEPRIRLGMVGGGEGAFIGAVHRIAARLDDRYELVAGALSASPDKAIWSAAAIGLGSDRSYPDFRTMTQPITPRAFRLRAFKKYKTVLQRPPSGAQKV